MRSADRAMIDPGRSTAMIRCDIRSKSGQPDASRSRRASRPCVRPLRRSQPRSFRSAPPCNLHRGNAVEHQENSPGSDGASCSAASASGASASASGSAAAASASNGTACATSLGGLQLALTGRVEATDKEQSIGQEVTASCPT